MQRRTPIQAPPFGQNKRRGKETSMVVEIALKVSKKEKPWILDSGCSLHMTGDSKMLKGVAKYDEGSVKFGNDGALKIQGIGAAEIGVEKLKSKKMLYVEGLKYNLISVSQLCNDGHEVTFNKSDQNSKFFLFACYAFLTYPLNISLHAWPKEMFIEDI